MVHIRFPDPAHTRRTGRMGRPRRTGRMGRSHRARRTGRMGCAGIVALALLAASPAAPARAGGVPVFDAAAQAQAIKDAIEQAKQLEQLVRQVDNMRRQLANMKKRLEAITGVRDVQWLLRSIANMAETAGLDRDGTMDALIDAARTGADVLGPGYGTTGERLERLARDLGLVIEDPDNEEERKWLLDVPASSKRRATTNRAETAAAALATAALAGEVHDRAAALAGDLGGQAKRAGQSADLKAAVDENTAAVLQLTALVADLVRLEAARARLEGTEAAARIGTRLNERGLFRDRLDKE